MQQVIWNLDVGKFSALGKKPLSNKQKNAKRGLGSTTPAHSTYQLPGTTPAGSAGQGSWNHLAESW